MSSFSKSVIALTSLGNIAFTAIATPAAAFPTSPSAAVTPAAAAVSTPSSPVAQQASVVVSVVKAQIAPGASVTCEYVPEGLNLDGSVRAASYLGVLDVIPKLRTAALVLPATAQKDGGRELVTNGQTTFNKSWLNPIINQGDLPKYYSAPAVVQFRADNMLPEIPEAYSITGIVRADSQGLKLFNFSARGAPEVPVVKGMEGPVIDVSSKYGAIAVHLMAEGQQLGKICSSMQGPAATALAEAETAASAKQLQAQNRVSRGFGAALVGKLETGLDKGSQRLFYGSAITTFQAPLSPNDPTIEWRLYRRVTTGEPFKGGQNDLLSAGEGTSAIYQCQYKLPPVKNKAGVKPIKAGPKVPALPICPTPPSPPSPS